MTIKNTSQFSFLHDKNSELNHFKSFTGVPFEFENETLIFKIAPYIRYEIEGDLSESLTSPKFHKREYGWTNIT